MKDINFPPYKTKVDQSHAPFKLEDPVERRKYFQFKAGPEIEKIKTYLDNGNTFMAFLLGKKNAGKGTYSKLFMEAVGSDRITHLSVGDIVRNIHKDLSDEQNKKELYGFLQKNYRGFISVDKIEDIITGRDTTSLLPTEVIISLVEREIQKLGKKAIFIDGFPRTLDQISYSLFFRTLMGYRDDPDMMIFIDLPESVIDERLKYRVVCPECKTPRNTKLLRTKDVGYDKAADQFYLICDNPTCIGKNNRMVPKEGDDVGIEGIRERINLDDKIMRMLLELQGIPKVLLSNAVPKDIASEYVDDYEITPGYNYKYNADSSLVEVVEKPWVINDDNRRPSYSLLPAPVAVSMIKQMAELL